MTHRLDATAFGVLLMGLWPVVVIGYDVWLFCTGRTTISERTLTISRVAPVFSVMIAAPVFFLLAHLFFPQRVLPRARRSDDVPPDDADTIEYMAARPFIPPATVSDFAGDRYPVQFVSAHDGDTIRVTRSMEFPVRLYGIDAPELTSNAHGKADRPAAIAARDALTAILTGRDVFLAERGDTLGRKLANVYVANPDGTVSDAGDLMVRSGHAVPYTP